MSRNIIYNRTLGIDTNTVKDETSLEKLYEWEQLLVSEIELMSIKGIETLNLTRTIKFQQTLLKLVRGRLQALTKLEKIKAREDHLHVANTNNNKKIYEQAEKIKELSEAVTNNKNKVRVEARITDY